MGRLARVMVSAVGRSVEMMFPNQAHKSCLRSLFARFLGEAYLLAGPQLIELAAFHAIAVKINLTAIRCGYETVIGVRVKRRDNPMRRNFMLLDMPLPLPDDVLKLSACSLEGVSDRYVNILMSAGYGGIPAYRDIGGVGEG